MTTVDDPQKPSLVDEPGFMTKLNDLDDGLSSKMAPPFHIRSERPARSKRAVRVRVDAPVTAPVTTARVDDPPGQPFPAFARAPDPDPNAATSAAVSDHPGGRRPLIDLFPPAPVESAPPVPALGTAEGPRLPPSRRALRREPDPPSNAPPTYETFYGLTEPPFDASADPKFLYSSTSHERVAQRLLTAIRRHDGFVLVSGASGVGKTIACRAVIEQLDRRTLTSMLPDACGSIEQLLQTVLIDFGVISRDDLARVPATRDALIDTLRLFLASLAAVQATALVIIDQAHHVPIDVLKELPLLAGPDGRAGLLQIVLVGQPSLLSLLRRPELSDLDRGVTVRCTIEPLAPDEMLGYVVRRLSVAGNSSRVEFDDGAILRLHQLTAGVPGSINGVCDRALMLGSKLSAGVIDARLVETAADELGVTPPVSRSHGVVRVLVLGFALFALALLGASGALWMFQAQAARMVVQWTQVPRAPGSPVRVIAVPLPPIGEPDDSTAPVAQRR
jgi:type II secretory pathway predicted ATPase ExeA